MVLYAVRCGREILFKNAQQYLGNQGLQLCAVAAFVLVSLWVLALSGRFPLWVLALSGRLLLPSCLLCAVVGKYSSKLHSNILAIKAYSSVQWLPLS